MHKNESNPFKRLWKEKGYYMLLGLCVVAVGVSGYFFVTGALRETDEMQEVLSVPVTVEEPETNTGKTPSKTQTNAQNSQQPSASEQEKAAEASAQTALEPAAAELPSAVMPVSGSVMQDYAMDRLTYNATTRDWRVHNGVDLAAELGQPVKAARAGTVTAVYDDEYYGTTVVIQHQDGYTSHYCNLAEATEVAAGDQVAAGESIGTVGATALIETASESHLHFEVYRDGEPVDPAGFLY